MVRFSDMLGGSGEPDDPGAESPYAALASDVDSDDDDDEDRDDDAVKEPVPMSTFESPEAVLSRLTQYATSARVTDHAAPVEAPEPEPEPELDPVPEAEAEEPLPPVGDDFLPNARGIVRRPGLGRKRHP
jgi:hypothetical protein